MRERTYKALQKQAKSGLTFLWLKLISSKKQKCFSFNSEKRRKVETDCKSSENFVIQICSSAAIFCQRISAMVLRRDINLLRVLGTFNS